MSAQRNLTNAEVEWVAFLFERSRIQILVWKPDIITVVSCGFPQPLQEMPRQFLKLGHRCFISYPFLLIIH
jgi:hypothetical protein